MALEDLSLDDVIKSPDMSGESQLGNLSDNIGNLNTGNLNTGIEDNIFNTSPISQLQQSITSINDIAKIHLFKNLVNISEILYGLTNNLVVVSDNIAKINEDIEEIRNLMEITIINFPKLKDRFDLILSFLIMFFIKSINDVVKEIPDIKKNRNIVGRLNTIKEKLKLKIKKEIKKDKKKEKEEESSKKELEQFEKEKKTTEEETKF